MSRRLLSVDPYTGVKTYFDADEANGTFDIGYEQDVTSILARNRELAKEDDYKKAGIKNNWMHAANIPWVVILKWRKEGIDFFNPDHAAAIKSKLNDPDYAYLKTIKGRV